MADFSRCNNEDGRAEEMQRPLGNSAERLLGLVLQYFGTYYIEAGSLNRLCLYITNNTEKKIEGWLSLRPPLEVTIEPGDLLMIAVRPGGTIPVEFYFSVPENLEWKSYIFSLEIEGRSGFNFKADFDLSEHLRK